jgi:hypothetical protein
MKPAKTYRMPPTTERALEAERYFSDVIRAIYSKEQKRLPVQRPKPKRLDGGCLLYRLPFRKAG